jgi:hypothetical protein
VISYTENVFMRYHGLKLALLCFFLAASGAHAACERTQQPQMFIDAPIGTFTMERVSGSQVAQAVRDYSGKKVSGATFFSPRTQLAIELGTTSDGLFAECVDIAAIRLQLSDPMPYFWVAEELPSGSCIEMELIIHENKHVEVYREVYSTFPTQAHGLVQAAIAGYPVLTNGGGAALVRSTIESSINSALLPLLDRLAAEADARNRAIDSFEEYERIRDSCNGSLNEYLR